MTRELHLKTGPTDVGGYTILVNRAGCNTLWALLPFLKEVLEPCLAHGQNHGWTESPKERGSMTQGA